MITNILDFYPLKEEFVLTHCVFPLAKTRQKTSLEYEKNLFTCPSSARGMAHGGPWSTLDEWRQESRITAPLQPSDVM